MRLTSKILSVCNIKNYFIKEVYSQSYLIYSLMLLALLSQGQFSHMSYDVCFLYSGVQFNGQFEFSVQNWAQNWAKFRANFSTRALQVETYLKTPNIT